jgi:opacity protein-like surface antigen
MKPVYASVSATVLALFLASPAYAADLGRGSIKDGTDVPYQESSGPISWNGFYVGGRVGYGKDHHDLTVNEYDDPKCAPGTRFEFEGSPAGDYKDGIKNACFYSDYANGAALPTPTPKDGKSEYACSTTPGALKVVIPTLPATATTAEKDAAATTVNKLCDEGAQDSRVAKIAKTLFNDTLSDGGIFVGGTIGADRQFGRIVGGVFAYYDFGDTSTSLAPLGEDFAAHSIENDGEWAVGARVGFLANQRTLLYVSAAYKQVDLNIAGPANDFLSSGETVDGVEAGAGLEYRINQEFSIGAEYTHFWGGEFEVGSDCHSNGCADGNTKVTDDFSQDKIMLIGRYRFGATD